MTNLLNSKIKKNITKNIGSLPSLMKKISKNGGIQITPKLKEIV